MSESGRAVDLLGHVGWQLDDAQARHRANPDTFLLPSDDELRRVDVGHAVRLIFRLADLADPIRDGTEPYSSDGLVNMVVSHERMWLWVERIEDDTLIGVLQNLPVATHSNLVPGARVRFHRHDVIDVDLEPPVDMDDELAAMSEMGFPALDEAAAVAAVAVPSPTAPAVPAPEGVSADVFPLYGARRKPQPHRGDCGWALWSQHRDMQVAADENGFDVVSVGDVRQRSKSMWRFLALPAGWAFTIGLDGEEDVFHDPELLADD